MVVGAGPLGHKTQPLGVAEHVEFDCTYPTLGCLPNCREVVRLHSGGEKAQCEMWKSQSRLVGCPWAWDKTRLYGSQAPGHPGTVGSCRRAENEVGGCGLGVVGCV